MVFFCKILETTRCIIHHNKAIRDEPKGEIRSRSAMLIGKVEFGESYEAHQFEDERNNKGVEVT